MNKIGVQTKGILDVLCADAAISMIADAGFERIDFNLDTHLQNFEIYEREINSFFDKSEEELIAFFTPLKEAMKKYGISASQMHAPYPVLVYGHDKANKYMLENVIPKSFAIGSFLEIPYMVIHPYKQQYYTDKKTEREQNISFFEKMIPYIKRYHVSVLLEDLYENIGGRMVESVCNDPDETACDIDILNSMVGKINDTEAFGICVDSGHLNLVGQDPYRYITTLGKRVKALHLHDNDGVGDYHQLPYSYGGAGGNHQLGIDWESFTRALADIHYEGTLSFETFPCMGSFPEGVRASVLRTIAAVGRSFAGDIEKERAD